MRGVVPLICPAPRRINDTAPRGTRDDEPRQIQAALAARDRRRRARAASLLLHAMGLSEEEIHRPFVGVASCWNEAAPCNIALMRQAQSAKRGVKEAGGTPREFCTITVTDGIAMGHEGM